RPGPCRVPVDPAFGAPDGPAALARPARNPVPAEERGEPAAFQVEDRDATVLDLGRRRAEDTCPGGHADDRPVGHEQEEVEPVAGQPVEEPRAAAPTVEQVVVRPSTPDVAGDHR